ncbi:MAG TPA: SH3 domain-containing protein [Candidatus Cloacimonadota bacterium]|nr:SH3 domain-containing protein [Candidatus Cloacimonadota bacterium]
MPKIILTLCILAVAFSLYAQGSEFEYLQKLDERGIRNADLYYNLGVGYWQTGQSGMATLYFLRALNLNSAHKPSQENLEYVLSLSQDKELYPQRLFLVNLAFRSYDFLNLNRLAIITLILLLLTALSLHWLMHYDPDKERGLPSLIFGILLFLLICSIILLGVKNYRQTHNRKAVLIETIAELKTDPDATSPRKAVIHEGLILSIDELHADWLRVSLPDGTKGWLPQSAVLRVSRE